ncbi:MAG: beta-galactosidase [Eubacteriales bacterium]|nr:beta-galactosidase [Eubacteriales bacterium]
MTRFEPISPKFTKLLHGADYNPDQWLHDPAILDEDVRLMQLAGCNVMSVGIFAWAALEPEEGRFDFDWLDQTIDRLWSHGVYTILATPTAARPAWMSQKYPEVLRTGGDRKRILHSGRHNHCLTSPVYRRFAVRINEKLAERYADHPGLLLWHVSNEYGGECHCDLCQEAFRDYLRERYDHDLEKLNQAWWSRFWSHTYTDWSQIESPAPHGENSVHGLYLDWMRFTTHQTRDFMAAETEPLRRLTPHVPLTANFMETYGGLDYFKLARDVDIISWDSYPTWHRDAENPADIAAATAFNHDLFRSLKQGRPFMLMESTPSQVNWQPVCKLIKPGMHRLAALQAIAHGSDTVQYFQWRKSRGSSEKFHGAVVDHAGHEQTRVFKEVSQVGRDLAALSDVCNTSVPARTAIFFDWENRWAIEHMQGLTRDRRQYVETCMQHHQAFWRQGIPVDLIDMDSEIDGYDLIIAPMLYMIRPGTAERLEQFVRRGGTLVVTYFSGLVDESDLCFLGGFPGPLRGLTGVWAEETDSLYADEHNTLAITAASLADLRGSYRIDTVCDLIHAETAEVLAVYGNDFYKGRPALTVNHVGDGEVYYVAARTEPAFLNDFYSWLGSRRGLDRVLADLPDGVTVSSRTDGEADYLFIQNYHGESRSVHLGELAGMDLLSQQHLTGTVTLDPYGIVVLKVV